MPSSEVANTEHTHRRLENLHSDEIDGNVNRAELDKSLSRSISLIRPKSFECEIADAELKNASSKSHSQI